MRKFILNAMKTILPLLLLILVPVSFQARNSATVNIDADDIACEVITQAGKPVISFASTKYPLSSKRGFSRLPVEMIRFSVPYNACDFKVTAQGMYNKTIPLIAPVELVVDEFDSTNVSSRPHHEQLADRKSVV